MSHIRDISTATTYRKLSLQMANPQVEFELADEIYVILKETGLTHTSR